LHKREMYILHLALKLSLSIADRGPTDRGLNETLALTIALTMTFNPRRAMHGRDPYTGQLGLSSFLGR